MDARDQAPVAPEPDEFSPLRAENVRRAVVVVTVVAGLVLIGLGVAWVTRPTPSAAEVRACELAAPVGSVSAEQLVEEERGDEAMRVLADVRTLARQAGNELLVGATRTAGTGLAELRAGSDSDMSPGQASALFDRGRTAIANECARLTR